MSATINSCYLCFSPEDTDDIEWLIKKVDRYKIPDSLVEPGETPVLSNYIYQPNAQRTLGDTKALENSSLLIILCSTNAAHCSIVENEVRMFRSLHGNDNVLCLILNGEPGAIAQGLPESMECFPATIKFRLDENNQATDKPYEPIAADSRSHADGKDNSFLKLVAGVLSVGFEDLRRRDLLMRKARIKRYTMIAVLIVTVVIGYGIFFNISQEGGLQDTEILLDQFAKRRKLLLDFGNDSRKRSLDENIEQIGEISEFQTSEQNKKDMRQILEDVIHRQQKKQKTSTNKAQIALSKFEKDNALVYTANKIQLARSELKTRPNNTLTYVDEIKDILEKQRKDFKNRSYYKRQIELAELEVKAICILNPKACAIKIANTVDYLDEVIDQAESEDDDRTIKKASMGKVDIYKFAMMHYYNQSDLDKIKSSFSSYKKYRDESDELRDESSLKKWFTEEFLRYLNAKMNPSYKPKKSSNKVNKQGMKQADFIEDIADDDYQYAVLLYQQGDHKTAYNSFAQYLEGYTEALDIYKPHSLPKRTLQTCVIYASLSKELGSLNSEYCNEGAIAELKQATKHKKYSMDNIEYQMNQDINEWYKQVDL